MFKKITNGCVNLVNRLLPDAFIFCIILTVIVFVAAMPAGVAIGVKPAISAMGIAWGDAWTNLLQPFWALPALGIAKLSARDIMGYCLVDLIVTGIIICVGFIIVGLTGISAIV